MKPLNQCGGCGKDFGSLEAFDAHRVGDYGPGDYTGPVEDWSPELGRRCLTTEEMEAREQPFVRDERGRWALAHRQGRARQAFEDGVVSVVRADGRAVYPARFQSGRDDEPKPLNQAVGPLFLPEFLPHRLV